jgi:hypothetical protein
MCCCLLESGIHSAYGVMAKQSTTRVRNAANLTQVPGLSCIIHTPVVPAMSTCALCTLTTGGQSVVLAGHRAICRENRFYCASVLNYNVPKHFHYRWTAIRGCLVRPCGSFQVGAGRCLSKRAKHSRYSRRTYRGSLALINVEGEYRYLNPKFRGDVRLRSGPTFPTARHWFEKAYPDRNTAMIVVGHLDQGLLSCSSPANRTLGLPCFLQGRNSQDHPFSCPVQLASGEIPHSLRGYHTQLAKASEAPRGEMRPN